MYVDSVQRLMLPVCVSETRRLMDKLQTCAHQHSSSHDKRPMMALSALLCLRRRVRSMVLNRQMMHMVWQAGGDAYDHLGQTSHMLTTLDRGIQTSEHHLQRKFIDLIEQTVVRAYRGISWTRMQWAVTHHLPSTPLRHLRCVLHSLLHGSAPLLAARPIARSVKDSFRDWHTLYNNMLGAGLFKQCQLQWLQVSCQGFWLVLREH